MAGKLEAIWLKRGKGAPMDAHTRAQLIAGCGLDGEQDGAQQQSWPHLAGWRVSPARTRRDASMRANGSGMTELARGHAP